MNQSELDLWHMRRALELAGEGQGFVEPNPMVGCLVVRGAEIVGEGWHRRFGGPHAEIEALRIAGPKAAGADMIVTLEPCCHQGKTPPCTQAIISAGIRRVVIAQLDPFPQVSGGGAAELEAAGIEVTVGLLQDEARRLNAPYLKLLETGRPWVIAKWAMTLCGKIATREGESRWISCEESRAIVHELRGRVDAIIVGGETARHDDPLLTARPEKHGPTSSPRQPAEPKRIAVRIVVDTRASLPAESRLVQTARETPLLAAVGAESPLSARDRLTAAGCEVFVCQGVDPAQRLDALLLELGRRRMTNVLVEGGGRLLGSLFDAGAIDEVHAFIAPKLVGGAGAPSPLAGIGLAEMGNASVLQNPTVRQVGDDVYISGRVRRLSP